MCATAALQSMVTPSSRGTPEWCSGWFATDHLYRMGTPFLYSEPLLLRTPLLGSPGEDQGTPAPPSHTGSRRRVHDASVPGRRGSIAPAGYSYGSRSFPQRSSTAFTALLAAWVMASSKSAFCLNECVSPPTVASHASLRVS